MMRSSINATRTCSSAYSFSFVVVVNAMLVLMGGCFFSPALNENGYSECLDDDECSLDRICRSGYCTPPRWNDDDFEKRLPLIVENPAEVELPAGAVVDLQVGGDDAQLGLEEFGISGRISRYDVDDDIWDVLGVVNDRFNDRLVLRLPVEAPLAAGEKRLFGWLETDHKDDVPSLLEVPSIYTFFDDFETFEDDPLLAFDDEKYRSFTGVGRVQGGVMSISDNQKVILREALKPPFSVTFKGRFNQTLCQNVFIGVTGDDGISHAAPSAGFFISENLTGYTEVAPRADSQSRIISEGRRFDNLVRRYRIDVGQGAIRTLVDYEVIHEDYNLAPPMDDEAEYTVVIDVDGNNCSFDLDELWVHPTALPGPVLEVGDPAAFTLFR
ncbi:MAG: hypothetical protein GY822_21945 [Deltaproteobacteria bacterium]|nr:hypothetical protein [Deltaproteobacteria bacterium]